MTDSHDPRDLAWHFLPANGCLTNGDGRKVKAGVTYIVEGPLILCRRGLHYSRRAIDALASAPGPIVSRVVIGGEQLEDDTKGCCTARTVLWMADASRALHEFAYWCAERALAAERAAGRVPDPRSEAAIVTKRRWLAGEATDDELAAAAAAAAAAAKAEWLAEPVCSAAWSTAAAKVRWSAEAAWSAAWSAAAKAAWSAAWSAACSAVWSAEAKAQNVELERLLNELAEIDGCSGSTRS